MCVIELVRRFSSLISSEYRLPLISFLAQFSPASRVILFFFLEADASWFFNLVFAVFVCNINLAAGCRRDRNTITPQCNKLQQP